MIVGNDKYGSLYFQNGCDRPITIGWTDSKSCSQGCRVGHISPGDRASVSLDSMKRVRRMKVCFYDDWVDGSCDFSVLFSVLSN
jgi:hypothetical protein